MFCDDLVIGERVELGTRHFSLEDIRRFAGQFDPQPFHLDEDAARNSVLGGLCASGWHVAAGWMRCMLDWRAGMAARLQQQGQPVGQLGPSPGFRNLVWRRPVRPGDTILYSSTTTAIRPSASRPGWALVFQHNAGLDESGREVFAFEGCVFWQMRPAA
jgi:acyl dehydratase